LLAELAVALDCFAGTEVLELEDLPDLDLAVLGMRIRAALDPFDRLGLRLHLDDTIAGDQLLRFREGAVDYGPLVPENLIRAPFELAWSPLASSSMPAFTISSLN